ncbi:MAG: hypothetical protein A2283_08170 [Lentisphaerae bacterium RIFOXYA12_FULL_48_11]|nr:MAG: hypothetical protein A2283_08170 [Lentisphaerae bacterium RIFOXYA12_FULL_48_11]
MAPETATMLHDHADLASRSVLKDQLRKGLPISLTARNNSMAPLIVDSDQLTVAPLKNNILKQNDILLIESGSDWIVHRLLTIRHTRNGQLLITKGDNTTGLDLPTDVSKALGRITEINHKPPQKLQFLDTNIDCTLLLASFLSTPMANSFNISAESNLETFIHKAELEQLAQAIYYYNKLPMLEQSYLQTLARNTIFLDEFRQLLNSIDNIDIILLKGAYLASCIYPSPGIRPFSDIDLLVKGRDFQKLHSCLKSSGYKPFPEINDSPELANQNYLNSVMYTNAGRNISIHVHWDLMNSTLPLYMNSRIEMDSIWNAARKNSLGFMELCPEHLLLHLAEHAVKHSFDRLILIRDIAEVIEKLGSEIDWDKFMAYCSNSRLNIIVYHCFILTAKLTAVQVPESVLAQLMPRKQSFEERLYLKILGKGYRGCDISLLLYLANANTFRDKFHFLWKTAFPPRRVMAMASNQNSDKINASVYIRRLLRGVRKILITTKSVYSAKHT